MRMDATQGLPLSAKLRQSNPQTLASVLERFGEERRAPKIARAILEEVRSGALQTTADLADLVRRLSPRGKGRIDPATRTFQALRIWVNDELDHLEKFLERALTRLNPEGRLAVISYHSLEDRRVKQAFRSFAQMQIGFGLLTKKPLRPSAHEAAQNPRARSAKLRGLVRTGG